MSTEKSDSDLTWNYPAPTLHASDKWIAIGSGNYYKGEWDHRTMCGNGVYVMPDGIVYEGNFKDGLFHGAGTMDYSSGSKTVGIWEKGKCLKPNYIFSDGLKFQPRNWQYCKTPDRRYATEHVNGLKPASKSRITNRQPTIEIPDGAYDTGDGFFYPLMNTIHDYCTNELIRVPNYKGGKWIMEHCRQGGEKKAICIRPGPYTNNGREESVVCDKNHLPTEETANDHQSAMAYIKSAPSSVLELPLKYFR